MCPSTMNPSRGIYQVFHMPPLDASGTGQGALVKIRGYAPRCPRRGRSLRLSLAPRIPLRDSLACSQPRPLGPCLLGLLSSFVFLAISFPSLPSLPPLPYHLLEAGVLLLSCCLMEIKEGTNGTLFSVRSSLSLLSASDNWLSVSQ